MTARSRFVHALNYEYTMVSCSNNIDFYCHYELVGPRASLSASGSIRSRPCSVFQDKLRETISSWTLLRRSAASAVCRQVGLCLCCLSAARQFCCFVCLLARPHATASNLAGTAESLPPPPPRQTTPADNGLPRFQRQRPTSDQIWC